MSKLFRGRLRLNIITWDIIYASGKHLSWVIASLSSKLCLTIAWYPKMSLQAAKDISGAQIEAPSSEDLVHDKLNKILFLLHLHASWSSGLQIHSAWGSLIYPPRCSHSLNAGPI